MKARGRNLVHVFMPVLVVCLVVLTYTAYAASPTTQKSTQPAKTATSATTPASIKYDPNAPPKGTITIPASSKGNVNASTWYTGSYQYIEWTCNGTSSNLVDVTLWQNNREVALIWSGATTGGTVYIVPFSTAAGNYELRVTSKDDTRVEARLPVTVASTAVTLATPPGALFAGSRYTINWSYTGNPTSVKLVILDSSGTVVQSVPNISIGSNGKGSWSLAVPAPTSGKSSVQCRFQIVGTFRTSVTSDAKADIVLGTSGLFAINQPTIRVLPFDGVAAGAPMLTGHPYTIKWVNEMSGGAVKVELYSLTNSTLAQTIQASVGPGASNVGWSPPGTLPANLYGTSFQIRVTSLDLASVLGVSAPFTIQKPQPANINCPDVSQIKISVTGPPGWGILAGLGGWPVKLNWARVSSSTIAGKSVTLLGCNYVYGSGGNTNQLAGLFQELPDQYICTQTATGAYCIPK